MSNHGLFAVRERNRRLHPELKGYTNKSYAQRGYVEVLVRSESPWKAITCERNHLYYAATRQRRCWVCRGRIAHVEAM